MVPLEGLHECDNNLNVWTTSLSICRIWWTDTNQSHQSLLPLLITKDLLLLHARFSSFVSFTFVFFTSSSFAIRHKSYPLRNLTSNFFVTWLTYLVSLSFLHHDRTMIHRRSPLAPLRQSSNRTVKRSQQTARYVAEVHEKRICRLTVCSGIQ